MHHVVNGNISQISDDNHPTKVWKVQCNPGFELFGQDRIKCRGGVMTAKFPVCASKWSYWIPLYISYDITKKDSSAADKAISSNTTEDIYHVSSFQQFIVHTTILPKLTYWW